MNPQSIQDMFVQTMYTGDVPVIELNDKHYIFVPVYNEAFRLEYGDYFKWLSLGWTSRSAYSMKKLNLSNSSYLLDYAGVSGGYVAGHVLLADRDLIYDLDTVYWNTVKSVRKKTMINTLKGDCYNCWAWHTNPLDTTSYSEYNKTVRLAGKDMLMCTEVEETA